MEPRPLVRSELLSKFSRVCGGVKSAKLLKVQVFGSCHGPQHARMEMIFALRASTRLLDVRRQCLL